MSRKEWAYASGRDRGWDAADAEIARSVAVPEQPIIPRAYAGEASTEDQFRKGWLNGISLRRNGLGVHGDPLGFTDEKNKNA